MKRIILGIDNGNKFTKTSSKKFLEETSVKRIEDNYTSLGKTIIRYDDDLYLIGEGRVAVNLNKFKDDDTFLVTIAAIAKELYCQNIEEEAEIILGVGLPLMSYSKYKKEMREYFLRDNITVTYKDKDFKFNIPEVYVYPQALAAFITVYNRYKEFEVCNVIDLGGYTLDTFITGEKGMPQISTLKSYQIGIITLFEEIKQELLRNEIVLTDKQIEKIIKDEDTLVIDDRSVAIINRKTSMYVKELINKLKESGMELRNPTILIGGGSLLLEKYIRESTDEFKYVEFLDIFANAEGYYKLTLEQINKAR